MIPLPPPPPHPPSPPALAILRGTFPGKLFHGPPHFIDRLSQWIIEVAEITSDPDTTAARQGQAFTLRQAITKIGCRRISL